MGTHHGRRRNRSIASQVRRAVAAVLGELQPLELEAFLVPVTLAQLPPSRTVSQWTVVLAKAEAANWIRPMGPEWLATQEGRLVYMAGLRVAS